MNANIEGDGVGVRFFFDRQRRPVTPMLARLRRRGLETWGLRNVTVRLRPGDTVALLGPSGAGKTTLLRLIAGVFTADEGRLRVRGRVASLLSTDAGLLRTLTGRENALLLGALAGMTRAEARRSISEIEEHAALGSAFDRPVSSFSQGMRAQLGFAVAEQLRPDILLLDEVHEALDHRFRNRVEARVRAISDAGGIVVSAGHDHPLLERLCNRALLLSTGALIEEGEFEDVVRVYVR